MLIPIIEWFVKQNIPQAQQIKKLDNGKSFVRFKKLDEDSLINSLLKLNEEDKRRKNWISDVWG